MKTWQTLFLISFLAVSCWGADTYHAGEATSSVRNSKSWLELSVGGTRSFAKLEDKGGYEQLSHLDGISGRALWTVFPWLGIGVEGTRFQTEKEIAFVDSYKMLRYGLISKLTFTPDTQPKVYLLLGAGKTKREFDYAFPLVESEKTDYFLPESAWK